jgi:hypothetical protein
MATHIEVTANLTVLAGLASLGLGLLLAIVGTISARRTQSGKLSWVSAGFFLLAIQGGLFALGVVRQVEASGHLVYPAILGLLALLALYVAVYRRT